MGTAETRPKTHKVLAVTCNGCGCLFEFFKKTTNQKCHVCNNEYLVFHDSMTEAISVSTPSNPRGGIDDD